MDIVITGRSALMLHRAMRESHPRLKCREVPTSAVHPTKLRAEPFRNLNLTLLERYGLLTEDLPLELSVDAAADRARLAGVTCHVRTTKLPGGCYQQVMATHRWHDEFPQPFEGHVFIDSPPLVIATQAHMIHERVTRGAITRQDGIFALIRLTCEFCGTYAYQAYGAEAGEVLYEVPPITSVEEVRSFLNELRWMKGIDLARVAAKLACDGLASPMELLVYAALSFPPRFGGLYLKDVLVNAPYDLDDEVLDDLGLRRLTPDFRFGQKPVVGEYQGSEHLEKYRVRKDKTRAQAYAKLGVTQYPIMYEDVRTVSSLERTLRDLVNLLSPYESPSFRKRLLRVLRDERCHEARAHMLSQFLPRYRCGD